MSRPSLRIQAFDDVRGQTTIAAVLHAIGYDVEFVTPDLAPEQQISAAVDRFAARHKLTPAEASVLGHFVRGASRTEVADLIGCSSHTCKWHLHNVFAKSNISSLAELVRRVLTPYLAT